MPISTAERAAMLATPEGRFVVGVLDALEATPGVAAKFPAGVSLDRQFTLNRDQTQLLLVPVEEQEPPRPALNRKSRRFAADVLMLAPANDETKPLSWHLAARDEAMSLFAGDRLGNTHFVVAGSCYATATQPLSRFDAAMRAAGLDVQAFRVLGDWRE